MFTKTHKEASMNSLILTIRALTAEFANRLFWPLLIIGGILSVLLISLSVWLTTLSGWWWLLFAVIALWVFIFAIATGIVGAVIQAVNPKQTATQKKAVKSFVDKLQDISDTLQTPKAFLLARIVWDVLRKNNNGLVYTMSSHTATTKKDFDAIRASFEKN